MLTFSKIGVSVLVLVVINGVAQSNPPLAGWIAATPVVSMLSVGWLAIDQKNSEQIADFLFGVLIGLIPTALYLAIFAAGLRRGLPISLAFGCGVLIWGVLTFAAQRAGLLGS